MTWISSTIYVRFKHQFEFGHHTCEKDSCKQWTSLEKISVIMTHIPQLDMITYLRKQWADHSLRAICSLSMYEMITGYNMLQHIGI